MILSKSISIVLFGLLLGFTLNAQDCDPIVPVLEVDLSADPNAYFESPWILRDGNCCGTTDPLECVAFIITLHELAEGIMFQVCDGAISPGSLFYQVDCGPETPVGEVICLTGPGPHYLTFCKPGNNENIYCITSVSQPLVSGDMTLNESCAGTIETEGFDPETIEWNSIYPGNYGQYNDYLDCMTCDSISVIASGDYPEYVEYEVCGFPFGGCDPQQTCETVTVYFNDPLAVQVNPEVPVICFGDVEAFATIVITGGTPDYLVEWDNGEVGESTYLSLGPHSVTVTDSSGCPGQTIYFTVETQEWEIIVDAGMDVSACDGVESINLSGSVEGVDGGYWSGGTGTFLFDTTNLINTYYPSDSELQSGNIQLMLTSNQLGSCPVETDIMNIWELYISSDLSIQTASASCFGSADGSAEILTDAGSDYTYLWSPGDLAQSEQQLNLESGAYSVLITDPEGCDTTLTFFIDQPNVIAVDEEIIQNPLCLGGNDGQLSISVTGGIGPYEVFWNPGLNVNPSDNFSQSNLASGSYEAQVIDANGCDLTWSTILEDPPQIELFVDYQPVACPGESVTITTNTSVSDPTFEYIWSNGFGNNPVQEITVDSNINLFVYAQTEDGCETSVAGIQIEEISLEGASISMDGEVSVCPGESTTLFAGFAGNYEPYMFYWSNGLGTETGYVDYTPFDPGYVYFTVTDICGNSLEDSVFVDFYDVPEIDLPGNFAQGCEPLDVDFDAGIPYVEGASYNWSFGNGFYSNDPNAVFVYDNPGLYAVSLLYTSPEGCFVYSQNEGLVLVFENPEVEIELDPAITDITHPDINFDANTNDNNLDFVWDFGDGIQFNGSTVEYTYGEVGVYDVTLTVINEFGCSSTEHSQVHITPSHDIVIPNVFTPDPNFEGGYYDVTSLNNNIFFPFTEDVIDFNMKIFNRWGELIFESQELELGWDGFYMGQLSPQDVYIYNMSVEFSDGKKINRIGDITLLR